MYASRTGSFCSRDPIGHEGSQWNLYEYAEGDPLGSTDPNGLQTQQVCDKLIEGDRYDCDRVKRNCFSAIVKIQIECDAQANGDPKKVAACYDDFLVNMKFCDTVLARCAIIGPPKRKIIDDQKADCDAHCDRIAPGYPANGFCKSLCKSHQNQGCDQLLQDCDKTMGPQKLICDTIRLRLCPGNKDIDRKE